jgi:hypothetical protein
MRSAWLVAGAVFAAFGAAMTATVLARGGGLGVLHVMVTPVVGWSFGAAGLLACLQRRSRRIGVLLLAVGFAWFIHVLDWTHVPALVAVGTPLRNAYAAVFAHLLLAFPGGRLGSWWTRSLVAAGYLDAVGLPAAGRYELESTIGVLLACLVLAVLTGRARSADRRPPATVWAAAMVAPCSLASGSRLT